MRLDIPQGSVPRPFMYLLLITKVRELGMSMLYLFVDDIKIRRTNVDKKYKNKLHADRPEGYIELEQN